MAVPVVEEVAEIRDEKVACDNDRGKKGMKR